MALIDKASLLMVPSTYEDGTLYNVLPSGNKAPDETGSHNGYDQTRADFTFSRGSNLSATRIGPSGLIEKGRENLLLQSNSFDTTWSNVSSTETSGQEGYDGTNNAWLLTKSGTNGRIQQSITGTGVYTFSVYAKAGANNWCTLIADFVSGTDVIVWFDLQNGIVGTESGSPIESKISSVNNGWYRISISFTCPASLQTLRIYVADADNDNSGTSGSIYIQDAQLEAGLVATDYIETTTTTAKAGVLENMPRIDYSSGAGALLLEPLRTNLYTYSEYYDSYTKVNLSVTTNAITSPEGTQNASKLVSGTGLNIKRIQPSISTTGTNEYIISAFVKKAEWDYFFIYGAGTLINGAQAIFNLNTGTIEEGSGHSTMEAFGDDGWYKITWKATSTGTGTGDPRIGITDNASSSNSTGDGVSGAYLYGLQIEEATYASSYIPTMGTSASRAADSCSVTGASDVIGQSEGTLFFEVDLSDIETAGGYSGILLSDGTSSNQMYITYYDTGRVQTASIVSGSVVVNISDSDYGLSAGRHKFAVAYKANDYAFYIDGSSVGTNTSASVPATSKVDLFFNSLGSLNHKEVTLFNERLTNEELATLTTL